MSKLIHFDRHAFQKSRTVLFVDDMVASHAMMESYIAKYNKESNKKLTLEGYRSVETMAGSLRGPYVCGIFDWNLSSTSILERGDKAIEIASKFCYHRCILTRMYDDHSISGYATKTGCWYIPKQEETITYDKVKEYLDKIHGFLKR